MTTNQKTSRDAVQTRNQGLVDGLKKHEATLPTTMVGGVTTKTSDVIAVLLADIAAANAVEPARAAWQTAVQAARDQRAKAKPVASATRQYVQMMFAGQIANLADFGLTPRKPRTPLKPEQKAASVAKAKATRAARHTMGTQQKKKVKGTVTTIVTPAGSTAAPSATAPVATPPAQGSTSAGTPHIP
jgi:hypothetical protein